MSRGVVARIDTASLLHNFRRVKALTEGRSRILAMVKANAYGHGVVEIAKALPEADALGVVSLDLAILLRQSGVTRPIVMMQGFLHASELEYFHRYDLTLVLHSMCQFDCLSKYTCKTPLRYWLKIDSGMNRLGFKANDFDAVYQSIRQLSCLQPSPVLLTHLSSADEPDQSYTRFQVSTFDRVTNALSEEKSVCNSAGIFMCPQAHNDWVRPGVMLYGVSPLVGRSAMELDLKAVMTLKARLIAVHRQNKGDLIGYSGSYRCGREMSVGVVNIGYGDGYPRSISPGTAVLIGGEACLVIGKVSMDMLTVDLTDLPSMPSVGDEVILWGDGLPVENVAKAAGMIPYELMTQITSRVKFVYC